MHVRECVLILAVLSGVLTLSACSVKERIHLFNHSTEPIAIRVKDRDYQAEPGKELSFIYEHGQLSVRIGGCPVVYRTSFRLPSGYRKTGWFRSHIVFQVEPDRRVFVLRADAEPPIEVASYPQPEGFPLLPELSDACRD